MVRVSVLFAAALAVASAFAENISWSGGDGKWSDGNWSPRSPQAGDDVTISSGTVTLSAATPQLKSLTVTESGVLRFKEPIAALVGDCVAALNADAVAVTVGGKVTHAPNDYDVADYQADGCVGWKLDGRVNIVCGTFLSVHAPDRAVTIHLAK